MKAILIKVIYKSFVDDEFTLSPDQSLEELTRLANTLEIQVEGTLTQLRENPDTSTYLGKGKVQELLSLIEEKEATMVISDTPLTPSQVRNLEEALGVVVMDRTELILKIFAQRAMSKEGKLQVELAQTRHRLTRLTGRGVAMSNPGAGLGTRGPGEQRIEMDRRALRQKIASLNYDLKRNEKIRAVQRKERKLSRIPLVSLVGYTNAGKSTLFNRLSGEDSLTDDLLFATLDPFVRKWVLPSGETLLLTDTVGFIQGLPHQLVAAFRSTLEDSLDADLLIHVIDAQNPSWDEQAKTVDRVLEELGAGAIPTVTLYNKVDKVTDQDDLLLMSKGRESPVFASALQGLGIESLEKTVAEKLSEGRKKVSLFVPYSKWGIYDELKASGYTVSETIADDGAHLECVMPEDALNRIIYLLEEPR